MKIKPHVLVVDDQADFRKSIVSLLASEGFRVSSVASGDEALEFFETEDPTDPIDLLLLDYRMPGRNGAETLQELRARGVAARAILLSATPGIEALSKRFGFDAALAKPCEFDEVVAVMRRLDDRRAVPVAATRRRRAMVT